MALDFASSLAPPSLLTALFLASAAAGEIGLHFGLRHAGEGRTRQARRLAAAGLGLLAVLVACSWSMTSTRADLRRAAALDEANALRDAAHLAPLLPDDDGPAIVNDLRRTLDLALGLGGVDDSAKIDAAVAETATVSARMWEHLGTAVTDQPGSLSASRMSQALTAVDDAVARRTAALRDHAPPSLDAALAGAAVLVLALMGYVAGAAGASRRGPVAAALVLSVVVSVTLDLPRFDLGATDPAAPLRDIRPILPPLP